MARYSSLPHISLLIDLSDGIETRTIRRQVVVHPGAWCDSRKTHNGETEADARKAFAAELRTLADDIEKLRLIPEDYWPVRLESEAT